VTFGQAPQVYSEYSVPMTLVAPCGKMMKQNAVTAVLAGILLGCGGGGTIPTAAFINQTQHSDAELQAIWAEAQQSVAQQIDLNPLQQLSDDASPEIRPGDPQALSVEPRELLVAPVPDVSPVALLAATGEKRPAPTGLIACPKPCNVRYSTAYSFYQPELTRYAASWEFTQDFNVILEYEFENHILSTLGYDMTWR